MLDNQEFHLNAAVGVTIITLAACQQVICSPLMHKANIKLPSSYAAIAL